MRVLASFTVVLAAWIALAGTAFAQASPSPAPSPAPTANATTAPPEPATAPGSPAPFLSPGPVASVDPAITARAKEWLHRLETGSIDRSQLNAQVNSMLTDALVKQAMTQLAPLGDPLDFQFASKQETPTATGYIYRVAFKATALTWLFALDSSGKIAGLVFGPTR